MTINRQIIEEDYQGKIFSLSLTITEEEHVTKDYAGCFLGLTYE